MAKAIPNERQELLAEEYKEQGRFNGPVRNMDANYPLFEGDIISIPKKIQALAAPLTENGQVVMGRGMKPIIIEFMLVEITNKDGIKRVERFFPNQLAKFIFPINAEGRVIGKVKTTGTATEEYCKHATVQEAMEALAGKKIKVVKATSYEVWNFRHVKTRSRIYQYDLI